MIDKDYIRRIAESKIKYHKHKSKISFEEKINILLELQKLDIEMAKENKKRKTNSKLRKVWKIDL